jgi:hypothetical protein
MDPEIDADLAYLFRKQIEEADLVCFSKADLYPQFVPALGVPARYLSSQTGQGVAAWMDDVLGGRFRPGGAILEIDYERYARAEASLAWLNCAATLKPTQPLSPSAVVGPLLQGLDAALAAEGLAVAHLKIICESPSGWLKASIVRNNGEPSMQGALDASPASVHHLLLNARAEGAPAALQRIVEAQLAATPGAVKIASMQCFSPSPPKPEKRISQVIEPSDEM